MAHLIRRVEEGFFDLFRIDAMLRNDLLSDPIKPDETFDAQNQRQPRYIECICIVYDLKAAGQVTLYGCE